MAKGTGRVVQIQGGVVDVAFPEGELPEVYEALVIDRQDQSPLVLEVQKHLGDNWVRTVSMDTTDGLQRGVAVDCNRRADHGSGWTGDPRTHFQCAWGTGG